MTTFEAVYVGKRAGATEPLVAVWVKLEGGEATGEQLCFRAKGKKSTFNDSWVGDVRTFEAKENDYETYSILKDPPSRRYYDDQEVGGWKLLEQAAVAAADYDRQASKASYGGLTLDQVREKYRKLVGRSRRAVFLAIITSHITG